MSAGFQCKQFYIGHQHCAMKVGNDALLLGSWTSVPASGDCLDIGCGSGVLSLMLANLGGAEDIVDMAQAWVEVVLIDAAVPGFSDHRFWRQATFGKVAVDEGGQFTGAGFGHGKALYCKHRRALRRSRAMDP